MMISSCCGCCCLGVGPAVEAEGPLGSEGCWCGIAAGGWDCNVDGVAVRVKASLQRRHQLNVRLAA
jgi:hypothetical protein